jgi:putative Mn2+ efflux pump MntP
MAETINFIDSQKPLPPTTTVQQDITHEGQRKVNLIWEHTQTAIAIAVTLAALIVVSLSAFLPVNGPIAVAALVFVTNAFSLVIGAYFQRTNHQLIGGTGPKPTDSQPYVGR